MLSFIHPCIHLFIHSLKYGYSILIAVFWKLFIAMKMSMLVFWIAMTRGRAGTYHNPPDQHQILCKTILKCGHKLCIFYCISVFYFLSFFHSFLILLTPPILGKTLPLGIIFLSHYCFSRNESNIMSLLKTKCF